MKKTVRVKEFCCSRCTKQLEDKLKQRPEILRAKTNFKKNLVLLEVRKEVSDEELERMFAAEEIEVVLVENRKSIFG